MLATRRTNAWLHCDHHRQHIVPGLTAASKEIHAHIGPCMRQAQLRLATWDHAVVGLEMHVLFPNLQPVIGCLLDFDGLFVPFVVNLV